MTFFCASAGTASTSINKNSVSFAIRVASVACRHGRSSVPASRPRAGRGSRGVWLPPRFRRKLYTADVKVLEREHEQNVRRKAPGPDYPFRYLDVITGFFVAVLLISNVVGQKIWRLGPLDVSAA